MLPVLQKPDWRLNLPCAWVFHSETKKSHVQVVDRPFIRLVLREPALGHLAAAIKDRLRSFLLAACSAEDRRRAGARPLTPAFAGSWAGGTGSLGSTCRCASRAWAFCLRAGPWCAPAVAPGRARDAKGASADLLVACERQGRASTLACGHTVRKLRRQG